VPGAAPDVLAAHLVSSRTRLRPAFRLVHVTGHATAIEDGFDVAVEFDVLDAFLEAQAGLVLDIPLFAGLVFLLRGQQGECVTASKTAVVLLPPLSLNNVGFWLWHDSRRSPCESRRGAPGAPRLSHVSTIPVCQRLEREGTSAGILARKLVSGLPSDQAAEGASPSRFWNLRTGISARWQTLPGMVVEEPPGLAPSAARRRRLMARMRTAWIWSLGVTVRVRALTPPVALLPVAVRHLVLPGPGGGHLPWADDPVGKCSRLYRLELPTRPNGVPSGSWGLRLPSLARGFKRPRFLEP